MNPLGFMAALGLGLPNQDGAQQIAVNSGVQNQLGGGRKRRVMVTGTPGSISANSQDGSMTEAPKISASGPDMPSLIQGQSNINGLSSMPTPTDTDIATLRQQITNRPDPYQMADAAMKQRGLGSKIAGGLLGFLQGGIPGAIGGALGTGRRQALIEQYSAANKAADDRSMDLIKLQDLADERSYKRSANDRDLARIAADTQRISQEAESSKMRNTREQNELAWKMENAKQQAAQQQEKELLGLLPSLLSNRVPVPGRIAELSGVPQGYSATMKPEDKYKGFDIDFRGTTSAIDMSDPANPRRVVIPGYAPAQRPNVGNSIQVQMPDSSLLHALATSQVYDSSAKEYENQARQELNQQWEKRKKVKPDAPPPSEAEIKATADILAKEDIKGMRGQGQVAKKQLELWQRGNQSRGKKTADIGVKQ